MPPHDITINASNVGFTPKTFSIAVGDRVTWYQASTNHTVTADDGTWGSSSTIGHGDTYSHTFSQSGTYTYHCAIHVQMTGTIVVGGG